MALERRKTINERINDSTFMWDKRTGDLRVYNACIIYRNFSAKPTEKNKVGGMHTFCLCLPDEIGEELQDLGWNVKIREPKNDLDKPFMITECIVGYRGYTKPQVWLVVPSKNGAARKGRPLNEKTIGCLDEIKLENIRLVIHPREHNTHGYKYKGYANKIIATQVDADDDFFSDGYEDVEFEGYIDLADLEFPEE